MPEPITRWEQFYRDDARTAEAPPSRSAALASDAFRAAGAAHILDVGCGAGRDTALLATMGASVTSVDAAASGLAIARRRLARTVPLVLADLRETRRKPPGFSPSGSAGLSSASAGTVIHAIHGVLSRNTA